MEHCLDIICIVDMVQEHIVGSFSWRFVILISHWVFITSKKKEEVIFGWYLILDAIIMNFLDEKLCISWKYFLSFYAINVLYMFLIWLNILWQGGGWCNSIRTCVYRKKTRRGSSLYMEKWIPFTGILSNKAEENPGFLSDLYKIQGWSSSARHYFVFIDRTVSSIMLFYCVVLQIFSIGIE